MQHISEIISSTFPQTTYKGSQKTFEDVKAQIRERWGDAEAERYDPYQLARSYRQWLKIGYRVRKGEKALQSVTFVEKRNEKGELIKRYPKKINLFYDSQVEPVSPESI